MIALLAVNNVAVNTTMFVGPPQAGGFSGSGTNVDPPPLDLDGGQQFTLEYLFGEDPAGYQTVGGGQPTINLLLRHGVEVEAGEFKTTYMNLFVNRDASTTQDWKYPFNYAGGVNFPAIPPYTY